MSVAVSICNITGIAYVCDFIDVLLLIVNTFAKVAKKNGKQAVVYVIFCFIKRILRIKVILPSLNINIMILFYYLCIVFSNLADSHVSECLSGFL